MSGAGSSGVSGYAARMCGRFTVATDPAVLAERFEVELPEDWAPSYNVAPTQEVLGIVRARDSSRQLRELRFGLIPHWAKDTRAGFSMINARAETVRSKGAYRGLLERRRALIVADGFYEWRTDPDGRKRPVRYTLADGEPFAFAGLWASWRPRGSDDVEPLRTCSIVTTAAVGAVSALHDRMPVILDRADEPLWLDPAAPADELHALLVPGDPNLEYRPVSRAVNDARHDAPDCLDPPEQASLF
jgi:putative SOS response-associated peptidase YedK